MKYLRVAQIIGLVVIGGPAYATLIFPQSPLSLEQQADLVVVASPSATAPAGGGVALSLNVTRVLKGNLLPGSVITAQWTPGFPSVAPAAGAGPGIWFLQQLPIGWAVLPTVRGGAPLSMSYYPTLPGPILSAYAYGQEAALSDKIAAELGSAIESSNGTYNLQFYQLEYGLIDQLNSAYVTLLFTRLSSSMVVTQRILGLAGLIRGGNSAAVTAAAQSAPNFAASPLENGILLFSIRTFFREADSASVAALGNAATDGTLNAPMREAAAHALSSMHTVATLPYLAALLNSPDPTLRAEAVGGIGSFANGLAMQTPANNASLAYLQYPANAPYMTAETKAHLALGVQAIGSSEGAYLSYWGQWWSQNKASLGF